MLSCLGTGVDIPILSHLLSAQLILMAKVSSSDAAVPSAISRANGIMRTMQGYEAIHMLHKRQLEGVTKGDVLGQHRVITQMCSWAASRVLTQPLLICQSVFGT
jgi:hypothetical protein